MKTLVPVVLLGSAFGWSIPLLFLGGGEMDSGWRSLPGARVSGSPEDLMPRSLPYHLPSILQAGDGPPQIRPYHTIIEIAEHK
jgi:hypothetical protein